MCIARRIGGSSGFRKASVNIIRLREEGEEGEGEGRNHGEARRAGSLFLCRVP